MIFIMGAEASGKFDFALKTFDLKNKKCGDGKIISLEELSGCYMLYNLHEFVRRYFENDNFVEEFFERLNAEIIICSEVGCGIVPILKRERDYRDYVGRIGCRIAKNADLVVRMTAGIPQVIKGKLLWD